MRFYQKNRSNFNPRVFNMIRLVPTWEKKKHILREYCYGLY